MCWLYIQRFGPFSTERQPELKALYPISPVLKQHQCEEVDFKQFACRVDSFWACFKRFRQQSGHDHGVKVEAIAKTNKIPCVSATTYSSMVDKKCVHIRHTHASISFFNNYRKCTMAVQTVYVGTRNPAELALEVFQYI